MTPPSSRRRLRPWMLVSATWIGPAIFGAIDTLLQHRIWNSGPLTMGQLLFSSGDWLLYALITPVVFVLARRWPLTRPHLISRALLHLVFALLFCVAWAGMGTLLRIVLQPAAVQPSVWRFFASWVSTTLPFGVAVYFAVAGIEHAVRYFFEARDRELQLARLSEQLTGARLTALQARLNPHFLFNSLNTIAVLVRDGDAAAATRVVEQLSEVLRRTLDRGTASEVALDDELELVRQYLAVEQARFSDRLRPTIEADPAVLGAAVPAFAVQHLVENAVRHGIARRSGAGEIAVSANRTGDALEILVRDDGEGVGVRDVVASPTGHGIEHTRERLRTLYGDAASLTLVKQSPHGTVARLRVPYHEIIMEATHGAPG